MQLYTQEYTRGRLGTHRAGKILIKAKAMIIYYDSLIILLFIIQKNGCTIKKIIENKIVQNKTLIQG